MMGLNNGLFLPYCCAAGNQIAHGHASVGAFLRVAPTAPRGMTATVGVFHAESARLATGDLRFKFGKADSLLVFGGQLCLAWQAPVNPKFRIVPANGRFILRCVVVGGFV